MSDYRVVLAREGRKELTIPEARLWFFLRDRRLHFHKFVRQKIIGRYRADFYCHEQRLVIKLDGASHEGADAQAYDLERTQWLEAQGIRVLRFQNRAVMSNLQAILETIKQQLLEPTEQP